MIRALCLIVLLVAQPTFAQDRSKIAKIEQSWASWASRMKLKKTSIVVMYQGRVVHRSGRGIRPDKPVALASLSKAITGACVTKLVQRGQLNLEYSAADYLGPRVGPGGSITISELLTHSGGNVRDSTQKLAARKSTWKLAAQDALTERALARPLQSGSQGRHFYNNENYAVLASIIEAATGRSYYASCNQLVLAPLGIRSARASKRYGGFSGWGGWQMSMDDYAKFAVAYFGPNGTISRNPRAWPSAPLGKGAFYGPGVAYYPNQLFWHLGMLCFGGNTGGGAYFAFYDNGWGVLTSFDRCIRIKGATDLEKTLRAALTK